MPEPPAITSPQVFHLWCLVESSSPFKVTVSSDNDIDDLKDRICQKHSALVMDIITVWKVRHL